MDFPQFDPATLSAIITLAGIISRVPQCWMIQRHRARHDTEVTRRLEFLLITTPVAVIRAWAEWERVSRDRGLCGCEGAAS